LYIIDVILSLSLLVMSYIHIRGHFNKQMVFAELYSKMNRECCFLDFGVSRVLISINFGDRLVCLINKFAG